jgi:protein RecA
MSVLLDKLAADLDKEIGKSDTAQGVNNWLDTGYPPLNKILSGRYDGGLPYGRICEIYGPSSSGKTIIATKLMISAQQNGGVAIFMDHENSFSVDLAVAMGLKTDHPFWLYKRPQTWEESNTKAMQAITLIRESKAIPEDAPIVVVFDSIAAMVPRSVFEKGIDEYNMNDTTALARVTSSTLKVVNHISAKHNACMVYLNQIRTKPGVVYGDPVTTPGGVAMEFFATIRLALGRKKVMEGTGADKEMTGQVTSINTKKNKVSRPGQSIDLRMKFLPDGGTEFDETTSLLEYLLGLGLLAESGPRIKWIDEKMYFKKALVEKINDEGIYDQLVALLPKDEE